MKKILFFILLGAFVLGACSPATSPSNEQPVAVVETEPVSEPATDEPASVNPDEMVTVGFFSVEVVDVAVEVGAGSPIPVFVDIGANLPDTCAQVELIEVLQDGTRFEIFVGTVPMKEPTCVQDTVPFRMKLPLNVIGLPAGTYTADVNSITTDFTLDVDTPATQLPTQETPVVREDVQVDDVRIAVGVGSPRPVTAVISANLPNACAQLRDVQIYPGAPKQIFVRLIAATPENATCTPDLIPMSIELPINTILFEEGTYEVIVNGATTTFEMPLK